MEEKKLTEQALQMEVNPVFTTARSCVQIDAAIGDKDAEALIQKLGFQSFEEEKQSSKDLPAHIIELFDSVAPVYQADVEVRFNATNRYLKEQGAANILDLPCGYTARGLKLAREKGINYIGCDLPAVADVMGPAVKALIGEGDAGRIRYCAVDATRYSSLAKALEGIGGELAITTEGLMMYLTQSELEEVFRNVHRILSEHGGFWITMDSNLDQVSAQNMPILVEDGEKLKMLGTMLAGRAAKTTMRANSLFDRDEKKAEAFVSSMGFDLEKISVYDYMPEKLLSYQKLSPEKQARVREAYKNLFFWKMTARELPGEILSAEEKDFQVKGRLSGNHLDIALSGRLDTISSPALLKLFRQEQEKGEIASIDLDLKNLDYISSAGLRVILIMKKALKDPDRLQLLNVTPDVNEILETTGFDTIFCG